MANRQTFVVGALGILVGMAVVASSRQDAQTVSFSGNNPNADTIRNMDNTHEAIDGIPRVRSDEGVLENGMGVITRMTLPRVPSLTDLVAYRRQQRQSDGLYGSAPTVTVRGMPVENRSAVPECAGYSGQRYTHCLEAFINGEPLDVNYYPISY